jgi:hypothetical protein
VRRTVLRGAVATAATLYCLFGTTGCSAGRPVTTARECGPTPGASTGPAAPLVTVTVVAPRTAKGGEVITVTATLLVVADGPRVVLHPATSALVLRQGATVSAWVGGDSMTDHSVPMPLTGGTTRPAQVVPAALPLVGCDGQPLPSGRYALQAVVGYGGDPLNAGAAGAAGATGAFQLVSDATTVTIE